MEVNDDVKAVEEAKEMLRKVIAEEATKRVGLLQRLYAEMETEQQRFQDLMSDMRRREYDINLRFEQSTAQVRKQLVDLELMTIRGANLLSRFET